MHEHLPKSIVIQMESEMPHSRVIKKKIPLLLGSTFQNVRHAWTIKSKQNAETEKRFNLRNIGIIIYVSNIILRTEHP